ncbi:MAG: methionine adenosyltransferase [Caulobacteraceae bacterium]
MARSNYVFTSESVSEGHPDKVADRISDTVVDAFIEADPEARVACETLVTTNRVVLAGEVRAGKAGQSKAENKAFTKEIVASLQPKVRAAIKDIGYEQKGFHWEKARFSNFLHAQSADIARGVDKDGAGDQGIMFGYACSETPELMPATLQYSHNILKRLAEVRHSGERPELEPDAKSQVTLRYENGRPAEVVAIVVSHQHKKKLNGSSYTPKRFEDLVKPYVLSVFPDGLVTKKTKWIVNPTGRFEIGGPDGDAGLTGRKIIVDTYGGAAPHGGGAFSGKDPTKVDRSAAYACRYLAKNVVAAGLADRCTIQISYAIGVAAPTSFYVDLHGADTIDPAILEARLPEMIGGATPRAIRTHLKLNHPIYARTAAYGHFGRQPDNEGGFSWERDDLVAELKRLV